MSPLEQALERFNRKERNLVVRAVLGHDGGALPLSRWIRNEIKDKLDLDVPETAWWGTDYHISWLAGALAVFTRGEAAVDGVEGRFPNPKKTPPFDEWPEHEDKCTGKERQLVEGNQEDVDLVIATGSNLILIEAKAYSIFDKAQILSKLARLNLLYKFYEKMLLPTAPERIVNFYLLLLSPTEPSFLEAHRPIWNKESPIRRIELQLNSIPSILVVTRCDEDGDSMATGACWKVAPYN